MISSSGVSLLSPRSSRSPSTGLPRTPILLRLFRPPLPLGLPISPPHQPHPLHFCRVRDTERSEHAAYPPRPVPSPGPSPPSHNTWNNFFFVKISVSQNETCFCTAKTSFFIFCCFTTSRPIQSRKRNIRKKNYFSLAEGGEGYLTQNGNFKSLLCQCTTKAKLTLKRAEFPVLENLSFRRSFLEKEIYIYIPSAHSLKSLNNLLKWTFVSILVCPQEVRGSGGSSLNLTPLTYYRQNCSNNAVV